QRAEILTICQKPGCKVQAIPGMYQLVNEEVSVSKLKDVDVVDLLGRDEIHVDNDAIFRELNNKVVVVTGGGGSIGSELCRQIAASKPRQLIIFDIYENNAYEIQNELKRKYPDLDLVTLIGSVRNTNRVNWLLSTYKPDYVYHAAAHKHVPLMEDSPNEAIKNNCLGTYKMAKASAEHGVKRFLLISTDKAVNPTNVMGASKRICEMIIQMLDRKYKGTTFCAVRFGNVLGSNGSVIPLFKEQIAAGGPVTVTDKNIIRYFMTIPEAVSLVLQSSFYASGGEIFVLDMGEPVRIDDMARRMIELSGFKPDVDIEIKYTGLRPGEKLYEELLLDRSRMKKTDNNLIFIEEPYPMDDEVFFKKLQLIEERSKAEDPSIRDIIKDIVPTFHPSES
ncbi:MAG: polysaccharide biosynthesis protein, partial [Lachnospiraceae bacterium]|nr:polysaccharide biosynthesis protein [Lachnospiraceae bacterium]